MMTNAAAFEGWKRYRLLPVVMALICIFLWGAMFARLADRQIGIDKDWLFLYLCGIEIVQPELHNRQIDLVKKIVAASGDDQAVYRATMRANYCNNYPFTSLSMYLAGELQNRFGTRATEDFPGFAVRTLWYGVVVSGGLLGILALVVAFSLTRGVVRTSLFMAIGLAALFYLVVPPPITNWFLYQGTPAPPSMVVNWWNVLLLGLHSWINPAGPFSAFSTFARSLCAMLSFAAFAIRWSGRPAASYCVPLLIAGIHQSTGLILLAALICCDIAIRPWMLKRADILALIGINLAIILLRERMLAILGFTASDVVVAAAIPVCLVVVLALLWPVRTAIRARWSVVAAWQQRTLAAVPLPFADALVIFTAWLGLILVSYLASRNDAWYRLVYFWSELSPRYIGMFQFSVLAGFLLPLIVMTESARPATANWAKAAVAGVMLVTAVGLVMAGQTRTLAAQTQSIQSFDKAVAGQRDAYAGGKVPTMRDETTWYYLLVRSAILGDRNLDGLFGKART